jgi:hypothetical protein
LNTKFKRCEGREIKRKEINKKKKEIIAGEGGRGAEGEGGIVA